MHSYPAARTVLSTARNASSGRAISLNSVAPKIGSVGLGVSLSGLDSTRITDAGTSMPNRCTTARASDSVEGSPTVGPEPITAGWSPGTSEIASVTTRAGCARVASRPPLMRERCFRTVFISVMLAPERSSARVMSCFSSSVIPAAGAIQLADAPPESSTSTRSSTSATSANSSARSAAARPAASGIGCPDSIIDTLRVGRP